MIVVFDECLTQKHSDVLKLYFDDVEATTTKRRVGAGAKDVPILESFENNVPRPILITADGRITRNKFERQALLRCKCHCVVILPSFTDLSIPDQAWRLLKLWPIIAGYFRDADGPVHLLVDLKKESIGQA